MSKLPEYPKKDFPITETWGRRVVDYLRSLTPQSSATLKIRHRSDGWTADAIAKKQSTVGSTDHPFKPYVTQGLDVKLIPGTCDNILPSNWNGELTLTASVTGRWVYLEVTIGQRGDVTSCEYKEAASPPTADSPGSDGTIPTKLYRALFAYDSTETGISRFYQSTKQNLSAVIDEQDFLCTDIYRKVTLQETG